MPSPGAGLVLIVEDDRATRAALRELLETEGYDVAEAANGQAALQKLRVGHRACVIILDLMMPIVDGWDFRNEQLKDPNLSDIPVIILTAAGFSVDSIRVQFGDIDLVPKPPPAEGLLATVRRLCQRIGQ